MDDLPPAVETVEESPITEEPNAAVGNEKNSLVLPAVETVEESPKTEEPNAAVGDEENSLVLPAVETVEESPITEESNAAVGDDENSLVLPTVETVEESPITEEPNAAVGDEENSLVLPAVETVEESPKTEEPNAAVGDEENSLVLPAVETVEESPITEESNAAVGDEENSLVLSAVETVEESPITEESNAAVGDDENSLVLPTVETVEESPITEEPNAAVGDEENSLVLPLPTPVEPKKSIRKMFREMAVELDRKYDKYERILRISRDMTIDSKRIIFLLHRNSSEPDALDKAEWSFQKLGEEVIKELAKELDGEDMYYYNRAYAAGLQEYTEAVAFHHFLKNSTLLPLQVLEAHLVYQYNPAFEQRRENRRGYGGYYKNNYNRYGRKGCEKGKPGAKDEKVEPKILRINVPQMDFVLGLCDLTGEMMRSCVAAAGSGNREFAISARNLVQFIYRDLSAIHPLFREFGEKMNTMLSSVVKMEFSCYQMAIKGGKGGLHGLTCDFLDNDPDAEADSGLD